MSPSKNLKMIMEILKVTDRSKPMNLLTCACDKNQNKMNVNFLT